MKKAVKFAFPLLLIAAGIFLWMTLKSGFSAREAPSAMEVATARVMRGLATPRSAKDLKNPVAASPENLRAGLEHFADHCAVCHANNGSGDTLFGRNMYPKPPDLKLAQTQELTDGEIYYIIQNGVRLTGMPAFGQPNQTEDHGSWQLVQFIRHLPKLTPEEEAEMKRLNPASPAHGDFKPAPVPSKDSAGTGATKSKGHDPTDHKH